MEELELYPGVHPLRAVREGAAVLRRNWKSITAYSLAVMLVFGYVGYRWVTTSTAVDRTRAVELFRAERRDASSTTAATDDNRKTKSEARHETHHKPKTTERGGPKATVAAGTATTTASSSSSTATQRTAARDDGFAPPEEGVYSWSTEGYEQVSGARREFPRETQRIVTWNGEGAWTTHHYFSEQREIWTDFHWGEGGAEITKQRNKITFGPVTNDSTIDFSPPMLVGPRHLKVGYTWGDSWQGDTYGDYSSKIFEHTTVDIGGETVEVWGISYVINLHGKQEGKVQAEVWLAPDSGMTVQEHYVQDVQSSGAQYHAEWTQKMKSMDPQR